MTWVCNESVKLHHGCVSVSLHMFVGGTVGAAPQAEQGRLLQMGHQQSPLLCFPTFIFIAIFVSPQGTRDFLSPSELEKCYLKTYYFT